MLFRHLSETWSFIKMSPRCQPLYNFLSLREHLTGKYTNKQQRQTTPHKTNLITDAKLLSQRGFSVQLWIHLFPIYFMSNMRRTSESNGVRLCHVARLVLGDWAEARCVGIVLSLSYGSLEKQGELALRANPGQITRKEASYWKSKRQRASTRAWARARESRKNGFAAMWFHRLKMGRITKTNKRLVNVLYNLPKLIC